MNKKISTALFLLAIFILGFLPVKDTDFGWHYRCGHEFLSSGKTCFENRFSYYLPGYRSYYNSLFYDSGLAFIFNLSGFTGLSVASGLSFLALGWLFLKLTNDQGIIPKIGFFLAIWLSNSILSLGLRSQIVSFFFFLFFWHLLLSVRSLWFKIFYLVLLQIIWVNTHIGFFLGTVLSLFYTFHHLIRYILDKNQRHQFIESALITLAVFLSSIVNPFGIRIYEELFRHFNSPLSTMIAEWVSPLPLQQLFIITGLTLLIAISLVTGEINAFELFMLLFFSLLSLNARRNLPFFYLVWFILLLNFFKKTFNDLYRKISQYLNLLNYLLPAGLIIIALPSVAYTFRFDRQFKIYCHEGLSRFPCEALDNYPYLKGNVFASYEWGGFLIWKQSQIKVFADGRMPAWEDEEGKSPYQAYLEILQTRPGWNEKLARLNTEFIFINAGTFLDLLLKEEAQKYGWDEQYRDSLAVIYRKL